MAQRLEHHGAKRVVRPFEAHVVLPVLPIHPVVLARANDPHTRLRQGARDSHVDGKAVVVLPVTNGPGRRPGASPRIPFFSRTPCKSPSDATLPTKFRMVLCRTMRSPDFAQ